MKVCTDSCLFGAFVPVPTTCKRILDIGTGTGLLSLMLAQKSDAKIDAVEIDSEAAIQTKENFSNSIWKDRLQIFHTSIQKYSKTCNEKYDLIISNPPFFDRNLKSPQEKRNLALHSTELSLTELACCISNLLTPGGILWIMLPPFESELFKDEAMAKDMYPNFRLKVSDKENSDTIREIVSYSFSKTELKEETIFIKDNKNQYSEKFISLLKDYYLYL